MRPRESDRGLETTVEGTPRTGLLAELHDNLEREALDLVALSIRGLRRMYGGPDAGFPYALRRGADGSIASLGRSDRYEAIALLGLRWLAEPVQRSVLGGESAAERCGTLIERGGRPGDLGDAAVIAWAAAELGHPRLRQALGRARQLAAEQEQGRSFTVESAWWLSALAAARGEVRAEAAREAERLLAAQGSGGLFPHRLGTAAGGLRAHVGCFADQVYPIQALARHHRAFGDETALEAATRCAERICALQGPAGQWWWHYDVRDGSLLEGYPVYSVHQDAMGPMCLLDLSDAGGGRFDEAIRASLRWMARPAEVSHSLVDEAEDLIWRKVGRRDPRKLVRISRALASRFVPGARLRFLDAAFAADQVDYESRPYHLGWVLATWLGGL